MGKLCLLMFVGALMMAAVTSWAEIPHLISYQGMLTDELGNSLTDTLDLTFRIYDAAENGNIKWEEIHSDVGVIEGLFSVILGSVTTPIPSSVFTDTVCYLGTTVGADPELLPRIRLTSFGYAYRAERADTSTFSYKAQTADTAGYAYEAASAPDDGDWIVSGSDVYSAVSGNVGIGTSSPEQKLEVADTVQMGAFKMPPGASEGHVLTSNGTGVGTWQAPATVESHWSPVDSVLYTRSLWGIARGGAEDKLWGDSAYTMVNFGVACTTGTSGQNYLYSTVGGGRGNVATSSYATIGGGYGNRASFDYNTVGGGLENTASGNRAVVGGGEWNAASGQYSTVAGGFANTAAGLGSFAAGTRVMIAPAAQHTYVFGQACTTYTPNAAIFHNSVDSIKVGIQTTSPTATLDVVGTTGYDQIRMRTPYTPTGTSDPNGNVGDIAWDDNAIYIKTSAGWKKVQLTDSL